MKSRVVLHKILPNIYGIDRGIWIKKEKVLVIGDLHIGYEEALNREGVLIPRQQFKLTKALLEKMFSVVIFQASNHNNIWYNNIMAT